MKRTKPIKKRRNSKSKFLFVVRYWLPPVFWALLIFGFSSNPTGKVSPEYWVDFVFKKVAHIVEYGMLTVLIYRALFNSKVSKLKAGYFSILIAVVYAISDEFHQSFTPTREPTIRDILFDSIGSVLSVYIVWSIESGKRLKKVFGKLNLLFELW